MFPYRSGREGCCTVSDVLNLASEVMGFRRPILVKPAVFARTVRPLVLRAHLGKTP